jgi:cytochrome c556
MKRSLLLVVGGLVVASVSAVAQSGAIASEAAYVAAMKEIGATYGAVQSELEARNGEAVLAGTAKLTDLFGQVQAFWTANGVDKAADLATQAAEAATAITTAINTQAFQEIAAASAALGGACQACHTEYREKTAAGFRITPGVL